MTRQAISTGSSANDGTGDTLRSASGKINDNFVELYNFLGGDNDTLASKISLNDSAVVFTNGAFTTKFGSSGVSSNRIIELPNASGNVVLDTTTQTLTNKTVSLPLITSPKISGDLNNVTNDEIIELGDAGASAVNHIKISNATTGNHAKIEATGDDTNVGLLLEAKGTGAVDIKRVALRSTSNLNAGGSYTTANSHVIMGGAGTYTSNLQNGSVAGEVVVFTNSTSGIKTIQPASFAQGSTIALDQYDAVTLIWDGSNWYIAGHYGATVA